MQEKEFTQLLLSSTNEAKNFALRYIQNDLPLDNLYNVHLNFSADSASLAQFAIYPGDSGKVIRLVDASIVTASLLRNGKVPVWIDIAVSEICKDKTILKLTCSGRYSDDWKEMYYNDNKSGPFGVKSPNLPIDYREGVKFKISETRKRSWIELFNFSRN